MQYKVVLILALAFSLASPTMYSVNVRCGTCTNTTGCAGNSCLIYTGDITAEYCYGTSSCGSFAVAQNIQIGQCSNDYSGVGCSSGVCMVSGSANMCYSSGAGCLNGVSFTQTCSGTTITMTMYGGVLTTPSTSSFNLGTPCPYTSATGGYSTCSGDILGTNCNCCFRASFTGLTSSGSCVPSTSPIVQVKAQLVNKA